MSSENEKKITLVSSDSKTFEVDMAVAELCQTIKNMVEDGYSGSSIPLPNVTSGALAKVIDYSKKHLSREKEKEPRLWEAKFAENLDIAAVFELMLVMPSYGPLPCDEEHQVDEAAVVAGGGKMNSLKTSCRHAALDVFRGLCVFVSTIVSLGSFLSFVLFWLIKFYGSMTSLQS